MARADQNKQYDLLTAALIGAAVGVSATLLLRGGIRGGSRRAAAIEPALRAARRVGTKGARWARERGEALWDRVPHDDIADTFKGYAETAREAIDRAVDSELRGLQKQLRRQRRRMHL
jgi:gas vesicle protein